MLISLKKYMLSTRGAFLAEMILLINPFEPDLVNASVGKWYSFYKRYSFLPSQERVFLLDM